MYVCVDIYYGAFQELYKRAEETRRCVEHTNVLAEDRAILIFMFLFCFQPSRELAEQVSCSFLLNITL